MGAAGSEIVKEVKSLELNLLKTTTADGVPTGHGNMFENCVLREYPGAVKVNNPGSSFNKLCREKNEWMSDSLTVLMCSVSVVPLPEVQSRA